jgi:hypothetical protein
MRRPDPALVARLLVVAGLLSVAVGSGGAVGASGFGAPFQTGAVDPDTVVLRADVAENGTAAWTIEYRVRLDDENTTAAFDGFAADVRANRSDYEARFRDRMTRTAGVAENATGRSMRIENVSVVAERRQLPQEYGVVSYRFEWTNFAAADGDRLLVGDALSGFFLDEETRLIVSWPGEYEAAGVTPPADERDDTSAVWRGPTDFDADEPRLELAPRGGFPTGVVGAILAALLLGGTFVWYRRRDVPTAGEDASDTADEGGESDDGEADAAENAAPSKPPEDLLSPEERVLRFVEERGGRVKQQEVVASFDWTAARTSQVVGSLRDDGEIETFRLGRENVITLPDDDEDDDEFGDPTPEP